MKLILFFTLNLALIAGCQSHSHKKTHSMHHDFSDAKAWSKKFDDPARDDWQKPQAVLDVMQIKQGDTVADIGAGTGYLLPHLSRSVGNEGKVYALEVENNLIQFMQERIKKESLENVQAELIPMNSPGPRMKVVDKVVVLNTWHHIANRKEYGKKMFNDFKSGATLFVVEPEKGQGGPGPKDHHRFFYADVAKELTSAGFQCQQAKENLKYQYIAVCKKN